MQYAADSERVRHIRKKRKKAAPVFGLWLFLLFCCLLASYFFLHSAYFSVGYIEVRGNEVLTSEEIVALGGLHQGGNIFIINTSEAEKRIETHPRVKDIEVKRILPQTLLIEVTERMPCAFVVGQDSFIAVDPEGVYLYKTVDLNRQRLPIISGVDVEASAGPGTDLNTAGMVSALELIEMLDQVFLANVAEIIAASPESLSLKTLQGVEVRFGKPEDLERKIKIIEELLVENGMIINEQTVEYIDLRYNTAPVIKRKS